ncbi:receptor-interacting serine/threonine-protein kinase 2 [Polypterus senegalus]|uniref:receptor-interacting serine/threonine-protein kinase 2 n=1 Tax=Polypterus senegalus TaxID=55291 RepID=UPI0019641F98|nr:receptor-interacting serine/threonine-protein kinase 2 [Polypterus senegalus]
MANPCCLPILPCQDVQNICLIQTSSGPCLRGYFRNKQVSIKLLSIHSVSQSTWNECLREVSLAVQIKSNKLLAPLGIYNCPMFLGIASDWMGGGSLHSLLYEHLVYPELPFPLLLRILLEVAEGLHHLHSLSPPLVHQALKPTNVLVDMKFHAKVCDFGLSHWRRLNVSDERNVLCTRDQVYLSPQIHQGQAPSVKDDVYSYGLLVWETVRRRIPFEDICQPQELVSCVLRGIRPSTGEDFISASVPHRNLLVHLITRCWSPDKDSRPEVRECVADFQRALDTFSPDMISRAVLQLQERAMKSCVNQANRVLHIDLNNLEISCHPTGTKMDINKTVPLEIPKTPLCTLPIPDYFMRNSRNPNIPRCLAQDGAIQSSENKSCYCTGLFSPKPNCPMAAGLSRQTSSTSYCQMNPHQHFQQQKSFGENGNYMLGYRRLLQGHRESIIRGMTEGRLNYILDLLRSRQALPREDYEYIKAALTISAKTRSLLDTCQFLGEGVAQLVVQTLGLVTQEGCSSQPIFKITY